MRRICIIISILFPLISFAQGQITRPVKERQKTEANNSKIEGTPKTKTSSNINVSSPDGYINGHGYVDLGLPSGTKWATCNVGANSPEGYGSYFAWGETTTKSLYTSENSRTYGKTLSQLQSGGVINSSGILNRSYDAASANWGERWRMPTKSELLELKKSCNWTWMTYNEKNGYKIIGPNGNSIFLPAAGYYHELGNPRTNDEGLYLGESVVDDSSNAYGLNFYRAGSIINYQLRRLGCSCRPVTD